MSDDVILGIHSNVRKGEIDPQTGNPYGVDAGHAWISVTREGKSTNYGLWPDAHPRVEDNGKGTDIRLGMEDHDVPVASRYFRLSPEQAILLEDRLGENVRWAYTNNCSSWARDTVAAATGVRLNADDPSVLGAETPRQLGDSIHQLERQRLTSPDLPADAPPGRSSSSASGEADTPLSEISSRLMRESEQHVRRIANDRQLVWDQGMDNTVAAVARQAREGGLTGISHMAAVGGVIHYAQADGYTIKEGSIGTHVAANTHSQASIEELAREDALQRTQALADNAVHRTTEMAPRLRV